MMKRKIIGLLLVFIVVVAAAVMAFLSINKKPAKTPAPIQTTQTQPTTQATEQTEPTEAVLELQFALRGEAIMSVEYCTAFVDPGVTAVMKNVNNGEETPLEVSVNGYVDTGKIGTFILQYAVTTAEGISALQRQVDVVDTKGPVITLVTDPNKFTVPGQPYEEEGYTAKDNHDGDVTASVVRVEENGVVTYTATDSFGNTTTVTRTIVYKDPVPPVLTLSGSDFVVIDQGTEYKEPGYTATDNTDGDLTDKVQVTGTVDTQTPGSYTLTYTVTDSYENQTTVTRTVFVKDSTVEMVNDPTTGDKFIYLTFDDGPGPYTETLLDILAKYNVKVTFFVVNTPYVDLIEREAKEGHTVAVHTATHVFDEIYASTDAYFADFYKMQGIIQQYTGTATNMLRFPGGSSNTISSFNKGIMTKLVAELEKKNMVYFDWNVDSNDAGGAKTPEAVFENVKTGVDGITNSVVLMHDIKEYTVESIERLIIWALENGYTFRALTPEGPTCHHKVFN